MWVKKSPELSSPNWFKASQLFESSEVMTSRCKEKSTLGLFCLYSSFPLERLSEPRWYEGRSPSHRERLCVYVSIPQWRLAFLTLAWRITAAKPWDMWLKKPVDNSSLEACESPLAVHLFQLRPQIVEQRNDPHFTLSFWPTEFGSTKIDCCLYYSIWNRDMEICWLLLKSLLLFLQLSVLYFYVEL